MFQRVTISGGPRERGRQYGAQAAPLIRHSIASYARLFAYLRGIDWAAAQSAALAYLPLIEQHAPDLTSEMRGIAEGAGRAFGEILALNARTELLAGTRRDSAHPEFADAMGRNAQADVPMHGECTTVAALPGATASGQTLLGQTWDWHGDQRAACVVLQISAPGEPAILTVTEAGMLAKIGLNQAGVGVSLNILYSFGDGEAPGMPVHVQLRRALQQHSVAAAVARVFESQAGASSCITLADARGSAVSLEITPSGVSRHEPRDGLLVHTNHCVTPSAQATQRPLLATSASEPRFDRASALLGEQRGQITRDTIMGVLRDHDAPPTGICRHPDLRLHPANQVESVTGVVLDLAERAMYVAAGIPCSTPFERCAIL